MIEEKATQEVIDDLPLLLEVLPPHLRESLEKEPDLQDLVEVVEDLGRQPEARFFDRVVYLDDLEVDAVGRFEEELLRAMREEHGEILESIRTEAELSDATEEALKGAIDGFAKAFAA